MGLEPKTILKMMSFNRVRCIVSSIILGRKLCRDRGDPRSGREGRMMKRRSIDGLSAEVERHTLQGKMLMEALRPHIPQGYVGGQDSVFYQPTKPPRFVSPDLYVVLDQSPEARPCYVVWEEGDKYPDVIVQITPGYLPPSSQTT